MSWLLSSPTAIKGYSPGERECLFSWCWCNHVSIMLQTYYVNDCAMLFAGSRMWYCQWFCASWHHRWWPSSCFLVPCWSSMMAFAPWTCTLTETTAKCSSTWRWSSFSLLWLKGTVHLEMKILSSITVVHSSEYSNILNNITQARS